MFKTAFILSIALCAHSLAQSRFAFIDDFAKNIPIHQAKSVDQLAKSLTQHCKSDLEKVRAIYVWISDNVVYDFAAFKSGNVTEQTAFSTLISRKAVCQGYSELFYRLCVLNQIDCYVVAGYSKGFGYKKGKKFSTTDHAWNAVKIDQKWYLVDATWGSGYIDEKQKYVSQFSEEHFLALPQQFVLKHLPADPIWQLMPEAISIETFEKDSMEIKTAMAKKNTGINYLDTLKSFEMLDSVGRIINSSMRSIKYNPENSDALYKLGWFYFQTAWQNMAKLNDPAIQRNRALARPLAQAAIDNQNAALKYLNEVSKKDSFYAEDIKQKKQIIAQNMKSLEQILK